jgi:uncharacterized protein YcfJ
MKKPHRSDQARDEKPGTGETVGEAVGGLGGTLAGAALGTAAGPIGTIIGGIAGGVGGWWAGEQADWGDHERHYRDDYDKRTDAPVPFETAKVGYGLGHVAGRNPAFGGRPFSEVENDLSKNWKYDRSYVTMRPFVEAGYRHSATEGTKSG